MLSKLLKVDRIIEIQCKVLIAKEAEKLPTEIGSFSIFNLYILYIFS